MARFLSIEAQHWVMQTRQFANLRRCIARASVHSNQPLATTNSLAGNER
jgi:C4-dicarboxylate-specific signal transduction histidine kinase